MNEEELRTLYWNNAQMIHQITELVQSVRRQNVRVVNNGIRTKTWKLQQILTLILNQIDFFTEHGLTWREDYLVSILSQLEQAQLFQDYILLGDLYELQLIPALQDIQAIISSLNIPLADAAWREENMAVLRERNPEIYQALLEFEKGLLEGEADGYSVEPTSVGFFTMALEKDGNRWYLHSNRNPVEEAGIWAERNYQLGKEKYLLFGWGMGYHVRALLDLQYDMDLIVVEPDIGTLYYSLCAGDQRDILEEVILVWDPEWNKTADLLSGGREVLLYRPSVVLLKDQKLGEAMIQIADQKEAIAESEAVFYQNIRENTRNCTLYVDEIRERINGKKVVIVAGGPSLDKNLEHLRERKEDVVILAVGTVCKLLQKKGISADYIVLSDTRVYYQLEGMEEAETPILLLATADRRISRFYQGPVYLICQQGHEMAAEYAEQRGYTCYSSGGSVATLALDIAIRLGAGAIAFIGLDLAYYGTRMHASGTRWENFQGHEYQKEKGWDGTELNTTKAFLHFRKWMEERLQEPDATMQVVDATEGGIVKRGFIPMSLKEFLYDENGNGV